ncbi:carbon-nitrogen hydrolase family protein [Candidatus Poribacteria bacterium]
MKTVADDRPSLPREVWVASICQAGLRAENYKGMMAKMLARMEEVTPMRPDIVCLPEAFHVVGLPGGRPPLSEVAEEPIGPISQPFADFARKYGCYVICPIYTVEAGRYYNAAVIIDRQGQYVGEYRKINPTEGELDKGITPGPVQPPVFKTDFGTIGVQICYDVNWHENWKKLREAGAEIVFWPSAFAGGEMLNCLAWINKYYVVSSTRFVHPTKIVDVLGDDIITTGRAGEWVCAPINLDKAVIQSVKEIRKLEKIRAKYGRKFHIKIKHVEAWASIEGLSADISVPEALKEFGIETSNEMLSRNTKLQDAKRPS